MTGWISLHRSIEDHWTFKEKRTFSKFEAWIDLLLMVNHKDNKVLLGNELVTVKRGQKITSIRKLCDRWVWSNNKVKNFLNLLEEDGMLTVKSDTKKTVLTIVNYDLYQNENLKKRHQSDGEETPKRHGSDTNASRTHTNNNVNNELIMSNKEDKKDEKTALPPPTSNTFDLLKQYEMIEPKNPNSAMTLNRYHNLVGDKVFVDAIQEAKSKSSNSGDYVRGILEGWTNDGKKTYRDIAKERGRKKLPDIKSEWDYLEKLAGEENG